MSCRDSPEVRATLQRSQRVIIRTLNLFNPLISKYARTLSLVQQIAKAHQDFLDQQIPFIPPPFLSSNHKAEALRKYRSQALLWAQKLARINAQLEWEAARIQTRQGQYLELHRGFEELGIDVLEAVSAHHSAVCNLSHIARIEVTFLETVGRALRDSTLERRF